VNFYGYATNNPLLLLDPWGLRPITKLPRNPSDPRNPAAQCGPPAPTKKDPECPPKPLSVTIVQFIAAAEIIHTGEILIFAGVTVAAGGGPVGVIVGVPVSLLGAGIVAVGVDAIPGIDLDILPRCF